jgi:hypothetical protein
VYIKTGRIEIHPRCKALIAALEFGQYDKNKKDFARTKEHGHNDMIAAAIYALRHTNEWDNPFPLHKGKTRQTHYLEEIDTKDSNIKALEKAWEL